jgi:protein involved in polysaccharide export with SLBB domain
MKTRRLMNRAGRLPVLLALAAILPLGCVRMQVIPQAGNNAVQLPLSEPRPVDKLKVPLSPNPTHAYHIGPRDVIRVDVRKDPTLSQAYTVTEEGYILLPIIGAFKVADLTTAEAEVKLNQMLSEYINEPEAKVGVQDYRSKTIRVVGQVNTPGEVVMKADLLTLQDAIFNAGLPNNQAAIQRTLVITPALEHPLVRQIDLTDIIYKGRMSENMMLKPNDIVYVPARYSINLQAAIQELIGPFNQVAQFSYYLNGSNNNGNGSNNNNSNGGGIFGFGN